jgi:hypothetical protein
MDSCFVWIAIHGLLVTRTMPRTLTAMMAEYVELALLEQSLANTDGMNRPFSDRVSDVAEKTGGAVLFDIRVDGDVRIQRMAAIGFGDDGSIAIMMNRNGQLSSTPIDADNDLLIAELTAWSSLPMAEQICVSYRGAAATLLVKLRASGRFGTIPEL